MPMGFGVKQTGVGGPLLLNIAGSALLAEADQARPDLGGCPTLSTLESADDGAVTVSTGRVCPACGSFEPHKV
jgi:hypothetical protein